MFNDCFNTNCYSFSSLYTTDYDVTIISNLDANINNIFSSKLLSLCAVYDNNRDYIWLFASLMDSLIVIGYDYHNDEFINNTTSNFNFNFNFNFSNTIIANGSCVYSDTVESLYYIGGTTNDIIMYNIINDEWSNFTNILSCPHIYGNAVILNNEIYIVGGVDINNNNNSDASIMEIFNITTNNITKIIMSANDIITGVSCKLCFCLHSFTFFVIFIINSIID